ncbi:hypothetical protein ACFTZI_00625 [Streptomyces decoyicus]|uniref:hypothetical protein n=1 Tax=Streptomyces decoyicus TaxID=249567 RepID=UPI00362CEC93
MLDQALVALASAGGAAVATAAGTDIWTAFRERMACVFGQDGSPGSRIALERLDRSAADLDSVGAQETERIRADMAASWQTRLQDWLETLDEAERAQATGRLRELVALAGQAPAGVSAGDGGLAVGGDASIRADHGSAAAGVMGDVSLGNPSRPGPDRS